MNERLTKIKTDAGQFWSARTKSQKGALIGSLLGVVIIAAVATFFMTRTNFVPLYKDLTTSEIGKIKEALETQGVPYEIAPGGTAISVPEEQVDSLLVQLASEGYPESGSIDYSLFAANSGFGMTDNEFNLLKLASTQTEIANLIKSVEGVKDAKVIITLPEEGVFVKDTNQEASAAIILNTDPGYKFTETQIETLYNLVSKSIPNLSTENIVISNQYSEYFDLASASVGDGNSVTSAAGQMETKKLIERDLQRQVQSMLGTMMGQDKVFVSVTTDIDFKQENREENLVVPVDEENMDGIAISAQRITESYSGSGAAAATGTPEAGTTTDNFTNYQEGTSGDGEYERVEETINNDVNRISKDIQESPYKIRDIGIQVMVEPPTQGDVASLPNGVQDDIEQILATIVRTTIAKDLGELTPEQVEEKIVVSVQPFYGKEATPGTDQPFVPWWIWVVGGILLVVIALLAFFILRARKRARLAEEQRILEQQEELIVDDINEEIETEATVRRKQLEKMAKDKPDDFAKLLRSWIAED